MYLQYSTCAISRDIAPVQYKYTNCNTPKDDKTEYDPLFQTSLINEFIRLTHDDT